MMRKSSKRWLLSSVLVVGLCVLGHADKFGITSSQAAASMDGLGTRAAGSTLSGDGTRTSTVTANENTTGTNASSLSNTIAALEHSFAATGAQADGYVLHDWAQLNTQFVSMRALQEAATQAADVLQLSSPHMTLRDMDGEHYVMVYGSVRPNTVATVVLSSFKGTLVSSTRNGQSSQGGQTLLVVDVTSQSPSNTAMKDEWGQIAKIVSENGQSPQISACIEGFVNARLMGGQTDAIVRQAYKAVDATALEGLHSSLETSVSGYTPETSEYIVSNGRRMNLQVAVHFDDYHHRTNVLVGTPIITIAY